MNSENIHTVLANHNGDPECLCGFQSPPVAGQLDAFKNVCQHVTDATRTAQ